MTPFLCHARSVLRARTPWASSRPASTEEESADQGLNLMSKGPKFGRHPSSGYPFGPVPAVTLKEQMTLGRCCIWATVVGKGHGVATSTVDLRAQQAALRRHLANVFDQLAETAESVSRTFAEAAASGDAERRLRFSASEREIAMEIRDKAERLRLPLPDRHRSRVA
jgi:hypothetical protein